MTPRRWLAHRVGLRAQLETAGPRSLMFRTKSKYSILRIRLSRAVTTRMSRRLPIEAGPAPGCPQRTRSNRS